MTDWKPKPKRDANTEDMNLTGEEGSVLSRIDGSTSMRHLAAATGLPEGRVKQIVQKLVRTGAVESEPSSPGGARARAPAPIEQPHNTAPNTQIDELSPEALRQILGETDVTMDDQERVLLSTQDPTGPQKIITAPEEVQLDAPDAPSAADDPGATHDAGDGGGAAPDEKGGEGAEGEGGAGGEDDEEQANYRKLFNEKLSKLEAVEREAMAKTAVDPELMALCFDPLHSVIRHMFENPKASMSHARMVARHHHTPQGLDVVMAKAEFFRDAQVQRALLQNTMLQEPQLKKLLQSKRLMDVYKVSISREIPERNRQKSRNILRSKWATAEGDERASLIFTTEGRCLNQLIGMPFDSQMTMLLCQKTYNSTLLIQNLARFGATPPPVLQHLMRQATVKRQQHLRTLIKQHPNCPADVKRQA